MGATVKVRDEVVDLFITSALPTIVERLQPELVLVFGSRVRGEAHAGSDLDVIVVAQAFADIPFLKRMPMLLRLARFPRHIDFLCYTPEEFEQVRSVSAVVNDALREGEVVYRGRETALAQEITTS